MLGEAIGEPDLKWVRFKDEDALNGMLQAGLPKDVAENFVEMGQAASLRPTQLRQADLLNKAYSEV